MLIAIPLLLAALVQQSEYGPQSPAFRPVTDDPSLPRVLLIGDSISIGYTVPVQELLRGKANVHRIPENGGPTSNGVAKLGQWLSAGKWDVIHFNFGLHDLKIMDDGKHQVPVADYEKNLTWIVEELRKTGARLIWCTTTPVPEGKLSPRRVAADVPAYNAVAARVMAKYGIEPDDLYNLVLPILKDVQRPVNVHFTERGSQALAEQVAKVIAAKLPAAHTRK